MIAIGLRFLAGRYHSTPWGRHVNEAAPEWPPSPWRLLRALIASWKFRAPQLSAQRVVGLLQTLAELPEFHLPRASLGHSRHYMPLRGRDTTLVFDSFVCVDRGDEVVVRWPAARLEPDQVMDLEILLGGLNYFGRADSWCEARLLTEQEAGRIDPNSYPLEGRQAQSDQDIIRVLCVDPESAFAAPEEGQSTRPRRAGRSEGQRYDPAWNICLDMLDLHRHGWSDPPGSRWENYCRPRACFDPPARPAAPRRPPRRPPQIARYALDSNPLPLATETLPFAEQARLALMGLYGRLTECDGVRGHSPVFSGKDAEGRPLTGHRHAFYLPTDEDGDGRLDHLTIVAEDGFGDLELRALDRCRRLRWGSSRDVRLLLVALGRLGEIQTSLLGRSRLWASATPFLVTRHPKDNGRRRDPVEVLVDPPAFVEAVLREELLRFQQRRGYGWRPEELTIERLEDPPGVFRILPAEWAPGAGGALPRPIEFKRFRSRKPGDDGGWRRSGAFRLRFPEPVFGPVCLGHSAHFGMGLFLPVAGQAD